MARIFFTEPHISVPFISLVVLILVLFVCNAFFIIFSVSLFFVARVSPIGESFIISTAKLPPEMIPYFLVCIYFFKILSGSLFVFCYIPLVARHMCVFLFMFFMFLIVSSRAFVGIAIRIRSLFFILSSRLFVIFIFCGNL